ncbi:MAG TPA: hypothetical protein VFL83_13450 [Anaeromyxobacter sp.]|nr:hypothetical protein [Anaeromyxobacter sp.]
MRGLRTPLVVAALFLGLGVLLAWLAEGGPRAPRAPEPEFPRRLREPELARLSERRTLAVPGAAEAGGEAPAAVDPFLAALTRDPAEPLLVLEANALRHSRIGELFVECLARGRGERNPIDEVRREAGIDPLKDVDRVAFSHRGVVVSGFFQRARLERVEAEARVARRGADGRVYAPRAPEEGGIALGTWRRDLVVVGETGFVEETLDRLAHPDPEVRPVLPEHLTYGEAYGVVPGSALQGLFRGDQAELGRRLAAVASRIEIHADAMRDVAVVARVTGEDADGLDDLGKAFGAALAVGRLQAAARGDGTLAELLEHARVARGGPGFSLELALPVEVVERWFEGCGEAAVLPGADAPAPPP